MGFERFEQGGGGPRLRHGGVILDLYEGRWKNGFAQTHFEHGQYFCMGGTNINLACNQTPRAHAFAKSLLALGIAGTFFDGNVLTSSYM